MKDIFNTPLLDAQSLHKHFPIGKTPGLFARARGSAGPVPRLHAVDDVTFTIARGETLGLVGESGCGKSTLVRLLTRLLDLTDGSIQLDGEEIGHLPAKGFGKSLYRPRIQMVFQDAGDSLNPRFTAFAAIADPLRRLKPLPREALKARVEELAAMCGLPLELLGRFPHQLSGGQKARVGIARAIAVEPDLLILDEPTAALDVSVQVVILQLLDDLKQRLGMSYLFVSHDLNVVRLLCDRVMVMYLGRIVETGPAERVFRHPAHPYTRALLSAIPHFDQIKGSDGAASVPRLRISGEPRSPIDPDPKVCRFHGRCPQGTEACTQAMPLLQGVGPGHSVACHFPIIDTGIDTVRADTDEPDSLIEDVA
ncbi:MAG: ATP-binding cassette domain-containing protein [Ferrovibrio sp.]|uniref:oligopeptide/dipeptide ABC transporter ATP-binding protein n=1 Tax=Ferrovibrio sp. TaxID=1917215 RepID=UPI002620B199|nr:oligopeptide/dipeptide ABC transporter ATP-binding protein [Ferrovibrio sp.]MCW0232273.1 ATP-binding cassette domain-containing protein [Ferrovibrio sp.]